MNKKSLNRVEDRISFLYIDYARIEQTDYTVQVIRGDRLVEIPIATVACLCIGPGTSITHGALRICSECGCSVIWVGEGVQYLYCMADAGTHSGKNTLIQAKYYSDNELHMNIVRKMYLMRYPTENIENKSLNSLRGMEGRRVKKLYENLSTKYSIPWNGREYDVNDFDAQDDINKCITWCNQFLYAIVKSVVLYLGYSPTIGFIHTGHIDAFVFDIADLYKEEISIPCAFETCSLSQFDLYRKCRIGMHSYVSDKKLMSRIAKDIKILFDGDKSSVPESIVLWDVDNYLEHGKNYG